MDTPDVFWLDTDPDDSYWEAYYRRDHTDRDEQSVLEAMCEAAGSNKEAWDAFRRDQRMAQAMYEV